VIAKEIIIGRLAEIILKVEEEKYNFVIPMLHDLEDLLRCDNSSHNHKD